MENLCASFTLFGASHWVLMLLAIITAVTLVFVMKNFNDKKIKTSGWGLVGVMLGLTVLEFVGRLIGGGEFFESLPLDPVNIFVFLCVFVQLKDSLSWIKFGYFISLPVATIGLFIVPNYITLMSSWSLTAIAYFLTIGVVSGYSILQLLWSEEYVAKKDILNSFINYIIIVAFVHIFNVILRFTTLGVHANYFGTMGEEYDVINKLLYKLIPVPFLHQLPIFAVVLGIGFLLIIPFDIFKTKKDRQNQMEELVALGNLKAQQDYRKSGKTGASQILVNSAEKAKPATPKNVTNKTSSGFVSVTKEVQVHKDTDNK